MVDNTAFEFWLHHVLFVTGKLHKLSIPQFPHLYNGANNSTYPIGCCKD